MQFPKISSGGAEYVSLGRESGVAAKQDDVRERRNSGEAPPRHSVDRQPLLWASLAFAAGIAGGNYLWRPPLWWLVAAIIFGSAAAYFASHRLWFAKATALGALFALGALLVQVRNAGVSSALDLTQLTDGREVLLTGHVIADGTLRQEDPGESRQTVDLESEQLASDGQVQAASIGVRLSFYSKEPKPEAYQEARAVVQRVFHYGERLQVPAKLSVPRNFRDPGVFDYRGYLADEGITLLGSAKAASVAPLPGFAGSGLERWRTRIRRNIIEKIQALWNPEQAALVDAIVLGEESFLGRPSRIDFQRTGAYHVLIVSGLKVGILAAVTFWVLGNLRLPIALAGAITVLLVVCYALLTGVATPVWRATLMLALYFGARLMYRQRAALNTIGAAALLLLILNPAQLRGASFQLSFLCVLIIAGICLPLLDRTSQPYSRALRHLQSVSYDVYLPPQMAQFRLDLRMIAGRTAWFAGPHFPLKLMAVSGRMLVLCWDFLLISLVLQAGLALPMAYYFHRAMFVAVPANFIAVPLTELIMVAAAWAIATGYVWMGAAKIPALVTGLAVHMASRGVHWLGGLGAADTRVATPELNTTLFCVAALIFSMIAARRRPLLLAAGLTGLAASALWLCTVPPHPRIRAGQLEVTSIDVGQGDSLLVVLPQGQTMLVDAGGLPYWTHSELDIGEDVVSPYLWSRRISHLDTVVITHAHADHIGGISAILENFHPRELWIGADSPSEELHKVLDKAKRLEIPVVRHTAGDKVELGGASLRILAPALESDPGSSRRANDDCIVMKLNFGNTSALLEGDAERATERRIAEEQPQADLLKVAHHGSATSTQPELLAAVHPRFAVISVGAGNVYGHPRWEVLNRLAQAHVNTYRTDLDGAVTFYLDGKRVSALLAGAP